MLSKYQNLKIYAFIDSQNLYLAIQEQGWHLDFKRFRIYLKEKYNVEKAYIFLGYLPENQNLYRSLQEAGFILIFKPILQTKRGEVKGNVDAELVLHAMIEYSDYDQAIIVTGDGNFYCLVKYLYEQNKLFRLFIPDRDAYSILLRKALPSTRYITFMNDLKKLLIYKKYHQ